MINDIEVWVSPSSDSECPSYDHMWELAENVLPEMRKSMQGRVLQSEP